MRTLGVLLLAAALSAQDGPSAQDALSWTRDQMAADLGQLTKALRRQWAYAEDRAQNAGVDLAALERAAVARLDGVTGDAEFVAIVRELVASIRDGHAFVTWRGVEPLRFRRWPFDVVDTDDGLVVSRLLPTWNETDVGVEVGDVVVEVDGEPIGARVARLERRENASTPGARRRAAVAAALFNDSDPSRYVVLRGAERVEVSAHSADGSVMRPDAEEMVSHRRLRDDVAYVRVSTFAIEDQDAWRKATPAERPALLAPDVARLRAAFAAAAGARALVLDVRGNGGGTDLLGMEVARCLLPAGSTYYSLSSRRALFGWSAPNGVTLEADAGSPRFEGQLIVLIDEGSFSATDNLCRCLDALHDDVTFVGRATAGGTGAPRAIVTLDHSGVIVGCCTMRVYGPGGELIEGRGTRPDVAVGRTRAAVVAGRDEDLEAALRSVR